MMPQPTLIQPSKTFYFSGVQSRLFFGGAWFDDIVTLEFTQTQDKRPFWDMAMQHWKRVGSGQILVRGAISVAFTRPGALLKFLGMSGVRMDLHDTNKEGAILAGGLDILVTYGQEATPSQVERDPALAGSFTAEVIKDVHFISFGKSLQPTADPVLEKYEFIARDIEQKIIGSMRGGDPRWMEDPRTTILAQVGAASHEDIMRAIALAETGGNTGFRGEDETDGSFRVGLFGISTAWVKSETEAAPPGPSNQNGTYSTIWREINNILTPHFRPLPGATAGTEKMTALFDGSANRTIADILFKYFGYSYWKSVRTQEYLQHLQPGTKS